MGSATQIPPQGRLFVFDRRNSLTVGEEGQRLSGFGGGVRGKGFLCFLAFSLV